MPRTQHSRKRHSTSASFTKFVVRLQQTLSSKNIKSSTPVLQQQTFPRAHPASARPTFPSFASPNHPRCRLSQILYHPSHEVRYLNETEGKTNRHYSEDDHDSCYDSMNEHRTDRLNLSQMNVSMDDIHQHSQPIKHLKLTAAHFHSTAINDISHY